MREKSYPPHITTQGERPESGSTQRGPESRLQTGRASEQEVSLDSQRTERSPQISYEQRVSLPSQHYSQPEVLLRDTIPRK